MATITTNTYLDDGTTRVEGEVFAIKNGAKFTIRTDTRWHADAPAGMIGTLSNCSMTQPNTLFYIDATKVRWMAYDTGTGNVPAIGTTITQGGVSGYLLGVWASLTVAPTAVGAAMPASGFLKFREITGGPYSVGVLTGVGANATEPDRAGWIEVVMDQSRAFIYSYTARGLQTDGDWFELGTTTGVAGQIIQVPTNGGGANTWVGGVEIETSTAGVYEWWPAIGASNFTTTHLSTDVRAKVLRTYGSGQLMIGSTGAANAGYTPPAGRKIRCPNIFLRQCSTGARSVNTNSNTNVPNFISSSSNGAKIELKYVMTDWEANFRQAYSFNLVNSCFSQYGFTMEKISGPSYITNCCICNFSSEGHVGSTQPGIIGILNQLTINKLYFGSSASILKFRNSKNITINEFNGIYPINNGRGISFQVDYCSDLTFTNLSTVGSYQVFNNSNRININNYDYILSCKGDTSSSFDGSSNGMLNFNYCGDITVDNITFGKNGTILNVQPYQALISVVGNTGPITVQNSGTRAAPLYCGPNNTNAPLYFLSFISPTVGNSVKFKRVYVTGIRGGTPYFNLGGVLVLDTSFENCGIGFGNTITTGSGNNSVHKGIIASRVDQNLSTTCIGHPALDWFNSETSGSVLFNFMSQDVTSTTYFVQSGSNITAFFNSNGTQLSAVGDQLISEMLYFAKGHTAFLNETPVKVGYGITAPNIVPTYQIDVGNGYGGTWKDLTGTNLSSETINPAIGFKIKIKLTSTTASDSNYIQNLVIKTTTTASDIDNNLYPLSVSTMGFTGLIPGSEVRCYSGTDPATSTEIGGIESTVGSTFSFTHEAGGQDGYITILAMGYMPVYLPYTFKTTDDSILIQPVVDRNYSNPA